MGEAKNQRLCHAAEVADLPDLRGDAAIHLARDASTAQALQRGGACPNLRNHDGATALHVAVRRRTHVAHAHVGGAVVAAAAAVSSSSSSCSSNNSNGNANSSFSEQQCALVVALLSGGADANAIERFHACTPLHLAVAGGRLDLVKRFFVASHSFLEMDLRDHDGNAALHLCCHFAGLRSSLLLSRVSMASPSHLAPVGTMGTRIGRRLSWLPTTTAMAAAREGRTTTRTATAAVATAGRCCSGAASSGWSGPVAPSAAGARTYMHMLEGSGSGGGFGGSNNNNNNNNNNNTLLGAGATLDEDEALLQEELQILQLLLSRRGPQRRELPRAAPAARALREPDLRGRPSPAGLPPASWAGADPRLPGRSTGRCAAAAQGRT